jgi:hypothetical protein
MLSGDFSQPTVFTATGVEWKNGRWTMAKVIEFYVPKDFRKKAQPSVSEEKLGQLIEFAPQPKKSA